MDRILVISNTFMCWPVDAVTLESLACSSYDPWVWFDSQPDFIEKITEGEWLRRKAALSKENSDE